MGAFYMQRYSFVPQIIDMIIAVIVYVTAISSALQIVFKRYREQIKSWSKRIFKKKEGQ
jgi:hypothetical protein